MRQKEWTNKRHVRKGVEDKVEGRGAETVKIRCRRENNDKSSEQSLTIYSPSYAVKDTDITASEELVQQESVRNSGRVVEKILTKEKAVVSIGEQAADFFNSNIDQQMPEELQDKQDTGEEESLEANIQEIGRE